MEAQFLVIKDKVLNRTKEVNINGLLQKLCDDLEGHYRTKLLNVSNGKFDGCYADRFKGIGKCKMGKIGFHVPDYDEMVFLSNYIVNHGNNQFQVPSFTDKQSEKSYLVDMDVNVCECKVGFDGSVCKHQYMLWSLKLASSTNFLPYLDSSERQKYAYIADGLWLPLHHFEG